MNALRFNDWQGRLTSLYNSAGDATDVPFHEAACLLTGVRDDGYPAVPPSAHNQARILLLLDPNGVVAKELYLQGQRIYGNHGTYCSIPDVYSFRAVESRANIPAPNFFDTVTQARDILVALGRPYDASIPSRYTLKIARSCLCPHRKVIITSGDLAYHDSDDSYEQIVFFCGVPDEQGEFEYIARRGAVGQIANSPSRIFTNYHPVSYVIRRVKRESTFITTNHACFLLNCSIDDNRLINHSEPVDGEDKFVLLDGTRAFPPRKG